jgi:YggT family protein
MMRSVFITLALLISVCTSFRLAPLSPLASRSSRSRSASGAVSTAPATSRRPSSSAPASSSRLHAVLPGDPLVTGTLSQGVINGISIYSNIIFARIALSWFPQLPQQFPILKPIFTVTEPYLRAFRQTIPPVAGFDISAIPAVFILDILGQTAAAVGADLPPSL